MPTGMNATQRAVNTAETRLRTWLHIVARTKTIPKDYNKYTSKASRTLLKSLKSLFAKPNRGAIGAQK